MPATLALMRKQTNRRARVFACSDAIPGEYCQWETFNATCTADRDVTGGVFISHVIVMMSARYGRMRFGRCMREDHGSAGCAADVLPHLDRKCSGRTSCHMTIPDAALHGVHPCPKELMPYLEASYVCLPGNVYATSAFFLGDANIRTVIIFIASVLAVIKCFL